MRDMPWSTALLFTAAAFGAATVVLIWACAYFSEEKREMRAIRKHRRQRRKAWYVLRSTAKRDAFQEFEGAHSRERLPW